MNSLKLKITARRSLLLILWALLPAIASASSVTVAPGTVEGPSGGKVKIPIEVEDAIKLGAIGMELHYDPEVLEYHSVREGTFEEEVVTDAAEREPGRLFLLSSTSARETVSDDGVLAYVVFRVKGGDGASSRLSLEGAEAAYDEQPDMRSLEMLVRTKAGQFTVNGVAPPIWPWIAAGAGALVLIFGVLIARAMKRRRNRTRATSSPAETVSCHECGTGITEGAKFCPECGTPGRKAMAPRHCTECGAETNSGARFCQECGHPAGKPALKATA